MGSGKSTVGPILAQRLKRCFIDLDHLIERSEKSNIPEIFDSYGEVYFRKLESRTLKAILNQLPSVVALGGGAFAQKLNQDIVFKSGITVNLKISLDLAWQRSSQMDNRPLARNRQLFENLFLQRQNDYKLADLCIEIEDKSPQQICHEIQSTLKGIQRIPNRSLPQDTSDTAKDYRQKKSD